MSKEEFFINAKLTVQGFIYDFQLDLEDGAIHFLANDGDYYQQVRWTLDDVIKTIQKLLHHAVHDGDIVLQHPKDIDLIDITEDMVEFDFSEIPQFLIGDWDIWNAISEFAEHYYSSFYDVDVFEAAHDCDIQFSYIDECYQGEHDSDEDFVQDWYGVHHNREVEGWSPRDLPSYIHIDWERTARDIMYDYQESNGHYFRNI